MPRLFLVFLFLSVPFITFSQQQDYINVLKVRGKYGIIDRGVNQGIHKGQILVVKRSTPQGLIFIGKVKVIRTTANRAAVIQISVSDQPILYKGDRLYPENSTIITDPVVIQGSRSQHSEVTNHVNSPKNSLPEPTRKQDPPLVSTQDYFVRGRKNPIIGFDIGSIVPTGNLSNVFSPSFRFGFNYMVPMGRFNRIGVEINKTLLNNSLLTQGEFSDFSKVSTSVLEGLVVLQRFFGNHFFIEGGGGIYRLKIQTTSLDDFKSTISSTSLGFFAGTGVFIPTSPYAGFSLKSRLHNYFNHGNHQYYGITGGFRFELDSTH